MAGLIADIGATNARFALTTPDGGWRSGRIYLCADFATLSDAISAYLKDVLVDGESPPTQAAICLPAPVVGDFVQLTNLSNWSFSIQNLAAQFDFQPLLVVNDFHANAMAVPHFNPGDYVVLGGGQGRAGAPRAVIGPGTGLGVALLMPDLSVVPTEGGHVTLPTVSQREADVALALMEQFTHSSAERAVSGPGLVNLAATLRLIEGVDPVIGETPAQVMEGGLSGACPLQTEAVSLFFSFLGSVCGNLVLTTGALGGLWLMGGILPRYPMALQNSLFLERYAAKGRFRNYVDAVPQILVTHPHPALLGLSNALRLHRG